MDESQANIQFNAFLPPEMAKRAEGVGNKKASMPTTTTFVLAILAGAFIAVGAIFATTVTAGTSELPFGTVRLIGGLAFCLGLVLVVVAGAELFTGNNLIVMAWAAGKLSTKQVLWNWLIVYLGNFLGAVATAGMMFLAQQYQFGGGTIGENALNIANAKCELSFLQAISLGALCNALVCLAVWLCYSARSTTDKIVAIVFPITAFVAAGFEHSVANMYFVPMGLLIKTAADDSFWNLISHSADNFPELSWESFFLANLLPVTIGNIIGGAGMVGMVYWFVYLRRVE